MNNIITTYGGGELFFLVFNGIAALFKEDTTGILMPMMRIGLMVGLVYVVVLTLVKNQLVEGIRWLLWVVVATNLLFLPKTRIHIHDPLNNYHRDVDNVPLALGVFASLVSQVGKTVTEKMESVFTLPDYMPYHQTGTVFASALMSQVGKFRITDPVFKGNMERFVNQCVVYDAMIGHKYTLNDLQNTPNIWELVTTNASPVLGFLYKQGNAPGAIVTCRDGARRLNDLWTAEIKRATALYGSRVQNRALNEAAFNTDLLGSARLLSSAAHWADSAQNILRQEMMINAVDEGSNNKLSELGSASNYAATKALLQQRSAYAAAGEIAARTLPLFKNVIEALSYSLFIFIVVLALLPNGHRTLLTYCGILVWTQLWAPLYAVLNLIMTLYGRSETLGHGITSGLTLLNSNAIVNANADMVTLAAWLSVSIPFISYGILKQGAAAFVGLAQHLGSAMQSAASGAAAETVSGNISLGNVTMGTQAYQNTSAFQHQTSPSYNASQFKAMSTSGVEQSTFADGTQALSDQGLSSTPVTLMASVNSSFETQQRLNDALSVSDSKSIAAGQAMETALQKTANVLERIGSDSFANENISNAQTSTESRALQDHHNFVKDISENLNVSKATASDLALHLKAGTPDVWLASIGGSTSVSSSMSNQEVLQRAQGIAEQRGYTYSLDSAVAAAQTVMEGKNDTKGAELAKGASSSLNEAQHLRTEASVAQSRVKELSSSLASTQRHDFQESRNVTQDFLEFVAHQPVNTGPGGETGETIGMRGALTILKTGGGEYQSYLQSFKEAHPQYSINRIDSQQEAQHLQKSYDTGAATLKEKSSLPEQYHQNTQHIETHGKEVGLSHEKTPHSVQIIPQSSTDASLPEKASPPGLKTQIDSHFEKTDQKLQERRGDIIAYETQSHKKAEEALQEPVIKGNAVHAFTSVVDVGERVFKMLSPTEAQATQPPKVVEDPVRPQEPILRNSALQQSSGKRESRLDLSLKEGPLKEVPLQEESQKNSSQHIKQKQN